LKIKIQLIAYFSSIFGLSSSNLYRFLLIYLMTSCRRLGKTLEVTFLFKLWGCKLWRNRFFPFRLSGGVPEISTLKLILCIIHNVSNSSKSFQIVFIYNNIIALSQILRGIQKLKDDFSFFIRGYFNIFNLFRIILNILLSLFGLLWRK
jgi:hypothetical protein